MSEHRDSPSELPKSHADDALPGAFSEWMDRVRTGDEEAARQLVQRYERAVRVAVRTRLTDPKHRREFDSSDVCQSVMASFFVRAAAGQFDLDNPSQLVGLLVKMAQNKVLMQVRRGKTRRRDVDRVASVDAEALTLSDPSPGPVQHATGRETLSALLARLVPSERELAQRRALGQTWSEIADELGGTPQGHRMKLSRAIDRVAPEIGIDAESEFDKRV